MDLIIVSILIAFLLGISVGFFIGIKKRKLGTITIGNEVIDTEKLKVLHKSEPKTFDEKRSEAIDKDRPIIKTFYK